MTTLADIGQSVVKFAPLLGSVLAGPAGGVLGTVLAAKFGGSPDDLDDLANRIVSDPQAEIKLRQIELDNEVQLQNIAMTAENNRLIAENERIKIEISNVISARQREENLSKAGNSDNTPKILAYIYTIGFFAVMILYSVYPALKDNMIIAALSGGEMLVLGYYFGSSVGSKQKDNILADAVKN